MNILEKAFITCLLSLLVNLCSYDAGQANKSTTEQDVLNHKKKEVVAFVYHRFGNPKYPSTNISLDDFENHLDYLKTNGFTMMRFGEAIDYLSNPQLPYIENVACITIDDGFKTFNTNALPLLKKHGFNATLFINSESVGNADFMTWEELKEVHRTGVEIGNHSHSHAYFLNESEATRMEIFRKDLQKCQEEIKKYLGFYPDVFAYPYGEFDIPMKQALKELGFKAAAAQHSGVMYANDIFAMPRFPMAGPFTKIEPFREKANMKALRVIKKSEYSFLLGPHNPPQLNVTFNEDEVDLKRFNCFVGGDCISSIEGNTISIKSKVKLKHRRELYKITAPSKDGSKWYWFSHLWIQPSIDG